MLRDGFFRSNFVIKLKNWEYWPFGIVQFPVILYVLWLAVRARSPVFFSASNPGITMGGMFGESKFDVLRKIPSRYIPATVRVAASSSADDIMKIIAAERFTFPLIFKPDLGERGFMVEKIKNEREVQAYLARVKIDFLIQELVALPLEFGVFYTRFPNSANGRVTSVVMKEMLTVIGDGKSTLEELILRLDRARLQWPILQRKFQDRLLEIPNHGQRIELVSIGNHCLGTKFLDGSHLINDRISMTFDTLSKQIPGFYFGRFDLRCGNLEDLYEGNIKIMELNGCGAEPAHIYHPGYSLRKAVGVLLKHWRNIFIIARENRERGIPYISLREALQHYKKFKAATSAV
jgi:hypothetical protein